MQNKLNYKLPEGKGKKKRQFIKVYRRFKYIFFVLVILILIALVIAIELIFHPFSVKTIDATNFNLTDVDKFEILGRKIYLLNEQYVNQKLAPNHLDIKSYTIQKHYPSRIEITAVYRTGVFKIKHDKSYLIIDDTGLVFAIQSKSDLPNLPITVGDLSVGKQIEQQDLDIYISVVKRLLELKLQVEKVYLQGDYIFVQIQDKYLIRFDIEKYETEIDLLRQSFVEVESNENISEISFVDNKVLIQNANPR